MPCFCDGCRGQNTYVLETRLLAAAYRLVKAQHPGFTLRILLTQGSYPVNDQVLAEVPPTWASRTTPARTPMTRRTSR